MMTAKVALFLLLLFSATETEANPGAGARPLAVPGKPAPPLQLEGLLQVPAGTKYDWDSLRGKVVVLEFWATTCGPCIQLLPHLRKLKKDLADEPIVFIAITDEDAKTVERFLEKHEVPGWIGIDESRRTARTYGIRALPTVALVNKDGAFLGWTYPNHLIDNPDLLLAIVRGDPVAVRHNPWRIEPSAPLEEDVSAAVLDEASGGEPRLCSVLIRKASDRMSRSFPEPGYSYQNRATSLQAAVADLYGLTVPQVLVVCDLDPDRRYDILVHGCGDDRRSIQTLVRHVIESTFAVGLHRAEESTEVYIMRACDDRPPAWEPALPRMKFDKETGLVALNEEVLQAMKGGAKFFMAAGDTSALAHNLSNGIGRVVIDEMKIQGYYHFYFPFDPQKDPVPEGLHGPLRTKYGICLEPDRRVVEVVRIKPAGNGE